VERGITSAPSPKTHNERYSMSAERGTNPNTQKFQSSSRRASGRPCTYGLSDFSYKSEYFFKVSGPNVAAGGECRSGRIRNG